MFGIGKEKKKQKKLKQQISDVQALRRSAAGGQVKNLSEQNQVNRAAGRLGMNPGMQFSSNSPARKKVTGFRP